MAALTRAGQRLEMFSDIKPAALTLTLGTFVLGCADNEPLPDPEALCDARDGECVEDDPDGNAEVYSAPLLTESDDPDFVDYIASTDPWHARLDYASANAVDHGFVIAGYDAQANVIGKISVYEIDDNLVQITHEYPRPCDQSSPSGPEDCADVLHVTVHLAEQWNDAWANAPAALFTDRATAIAAALPPDTEEGRLACALTIAATSAACVGIAVSGPIAAPGCALGALNSLCKCETFARAFPNVDWDKLCK